MSNLDSDTVKEKITSSHKKHKFPTYNQNLNLKRLSLIALAQSVLTDPEHESELSNLMTKLNLTAETVIKSYIDYNLDICSYGNEIYESLEMRLVLHIHNLLKDSWHQERQATVTEYIKYAQPKTIADLGFGEPSLYVKQALKSGRHTITLCDFANSAYIFAEALLDMWSPKWSETVSFLKTDMEAGNFIGPYDLYIFQDSIEHVSNPTAYLSSYVMQSPVSAKFLIAIPIAPIIPSHYMSWSSTKEAIDWLHECNLNITHSKLIDVNPDVDIFADRFGFNMSDYFVLCEKNV